MAEPIEDTATARPAETTDGAAASASDGHTWDIGRDNDVVRALNFAGGGLDTSMQMGVVHALLVIQGQAPDVVVGVSAGAVHAAALAEVLQAGAEHEPDRPWRLLTVAERYHVQEGRLRARVARFRDMLDAAQDAPEEFFSELMPDAYQVEHQRPLQPVSMPVHSKAERESRSQAAAAQAGLINLYNELLRVRVSFGTLTRVVRRLLGLKAVGDVRPKTAQKLLWLTEVARLWMLLGSNLHRVGSLMGPLLAPIFRSEPTPARPGTAGSLIFATRIGAGIQSATKHFAYFLIAMTLWVWMSVLVVAAPFALIAWLRVLIEGVGIILSSSAILGVATRLSDNYLFTVVLVYAAGVLLVVPFLSLSWRPLLEFNKASTWSVIKDGIAGILVLAGLGLAWTTVVFVLWLASVLVLEPGSQIRSVTGPYVRDMLPVFFIQLFWIATSVFAAIAAAIAIFEPFRQYGRNLLARYDIADSLFHPHALRQLFVRLFDPGYYQQHDMDRAVDLALQDRDDPAGASAAVELKDDCTTKRRRPPRRVGDYGAQGTSPIHVGLAVADAATGELTVVPDHCYLVDGLMAATAVSPFFPPVHLDGRWFLDGSNVANEPTRALVNLVRGRLNPRARILHIYSVASLPFSRSELGDQPAGEDDDPGLRTNLVHAARRALELQRFRDATLERRMTELFTHTIPDTQFTADIEVPDFRDRTGSRMKRKTFMRAWVTPVEPERPIDLNAKLLKANNFEHQRAMVLETVAEGCRAALEVMVRPDRLQTDPDLIRAGRAPMTGDHVPCHLAVKRHLARRIDAERARPGGIKDFDHSFVTKLPGAEDAASGQRPTDTAHGPGLVEVCRHCALGRVGDGGEPEAWRSLRLRDWEQHGPEWPHERETEPIAVDTNARYKPSPIEYHERTREVLLAELMHAQRGAGQEGPAWPRARTIDGQEHPGDTRPLVSLLFSGGVFRGVFQMGVLNALSDIRLRPDIVAGASIGAITAAMVSEAFTVEPGPAVARGEPGPERDGIVGRLAATYLALDRLILSDRFADFIRNLTLRGAACQFSLRQADRFFRKYDVASPGRFDREARLVIAGLERLFYLSPFELKELVKLIRHQDWHGSLERIGHHLQEWLDRMGVSNQVLGAEPLARLIEAHVAGRIARDMGCDPSVVPFNVFQERAGIYFLATTTNMSVGRLEILGEQQSAGGKHEAVLTEGLLASSAFPAVFRPRGAWEVMPASSDRHRYTDGGIMDNLPLDAVSQFLYQLKRAGRAVPRPVVNGAPVPHLIFAASLEVEASNPSDEEMRRQMTQLSHNWPAMLKRARTLRYNQKLMIYGNTQRALRAIWDTAGQGNTPSGWTPLDLEVVTVKPRWLCGTFAFHPMLGFRRELQAESMAHGCASTLLELAGLKQSRSHYLTSWGIDPARLPDATTFEEAWQTGNDRPLAEGDCWLRPGCRCPFSPQRLAAAKPELKPATQVQLDAIYRACRRRRTHEPR